MNEPITITFPSGKTVALPASPAHFAPAERTAGKMRAKPCVHLGAPIKVSVGCRSLPRDGIWECPHKGQCSPLSGLETRPGITACASCDLYEASGAPSLWNLYQRRKSAIKQWQEAGQPVRTAEEITKLFAICSGCPFLGKDKLRGTYCGKCGCPVNSKATCPTGNKIAMATEHCPLSPPRW